MSWDDLAPVRAGAAQQAPPAVEFTISKMPAGRSVVASVVVRTAFISRLPAFLAPGAGVRVLRGTGEDDGKLRVLAGGKIPVSKVGGATSLSLMIRMPLWAGLTHEPQRATVSYLVSEAALEIDLPAWACTAEATIGVAA